MPRHILIADKSIDTPALFAAPCNHKETSERKHVFFKFPIENFSDKQQQQLLQQHQQHQVQKIQEDQKDVERSREENNASRENSTERINMMSPLMSEFRFRS